MKQTAQFFLTDVFVVLLDGTLGFSVYTSQNCCAHA